MEVKQELTKLEGLNVNQVISLLKSWKLDTIMADTFQQQHVDGDALACMEEGDFDETDFPIARKFHWKKFWIKLDYAKKYGVPPLPDEAPISVAPTSVAPASVAPVSVAPASVAPTANIACPTVEEDTPNHKPWLLKTEICKVHARTGSCMYGDNCRFAHGLLELRFVKRHPRYKTRKCVNFWNRGYCAYGDRCCFIHNELPRPDVEASHPLQRPADPSASAPVPTAMPQPQPEIPPPRAPWNDQQLSTSNAIWSFSGSADASAPWRQSAFGDPNPWNSKWPASNFPPTAMPSATPDVSSLMTNFETFDISNKPRVPDSAGEIKTRSYASAAATARSRSNNTSPPSSTSP